jgi:hypothetical protein
MKNLIIILALFAGTIQAQGLVFTFPDATFEAGKQVEMPCKVYDFVNMAAFQWGILFDTAFLKLDSVKATNGLPEYDSTCFSHFAISQSQFIKPGSLYTLWTGVPCRTLEDGVTIFRAWFTAKKTGSLSQSIVKYPQGFQFEAVDCQFNYLDFDVVFVSEATDTDTPQSDFVRIFPNPFPEHFTLNKSGVLRVSDTSGQVVIFGRYRAGEQVGGSLSPGLYFGQIGKQTFKILKQ